MPPKQPPRFPDYFDRKDEFQEYAETSARCPKASRKIIKRYTKQRWDKYWSADKRRSDPKLTKEQFVDYADWDCFQDQTRGEDLAILNHDLKQAYDAACKVFAKPVVLAAMDQLTVSEATSACRMRREEMCQKIRDAKETLAELLLDYRDQG